MKYYDLENEIHPVANLKAIVKGDKYRFTILTSQMIRVEYSEDGVFEDRATQTVINRKFEVPEYRVEEKDDYLEIRTEHIVLKYNKKEFSKNSLSISVIGNFSFYRGTWYYGEPFIDLKGTARTLDKVDGETELERGLISKNGFSVFDDSKSLILREDGWIDPREKKNIDIYFLGYGHDFKECLKDFYKLSGKAPLLPRYTLGNWWSRYYKYTEKEYKKLIKQFEEKNIPFSISVMDMDWHTIDVDPKYGSGWTGYTWNREFFPDPKKFMKWLHNHKLKVTLNVHPANGIQPYEESYERMCNALGKDSKSNIGIEFDFSDQKFVKAYFEDLHHPLEDEGVDFWWVDWQQGDISKVQGLDPLWMLNHFHYHDSGRRDVRKLTFSRYAGLGSHRYPIGFSGDTVISWESLDFQPYFTSTASNVGYGWWSHDIGGHMKGYKDDELATRWVQFGVFSPISRLHSSDNKFSGKEPWNFNEVAERSMCESLRLRHQLIPYIYTMNRYASREGRPLILPMYYEHSENKEAYNLPNEYYFGTELIVCPITKPIDKIARVATFNGWLPEGNWYDFFSGRRYKGNRKINIHRDMDEIPVFAKAGSIIPMSLDEGNGTDNPKKLELRVFAGADGKFDLWEDEGNTLYDKDENWVKTTMSLYWNDKPFFIIQPAEGNLDVIPNYRDYRIKLIGFSDKEPIVKINGQKVDVKIDNSNGDIIINIENIMITNSVELFFETSELKVNSIIDEVLTYLNKIQIEYDIKEEIYSIVSGSETIGHKISALVALNLNRLILESIIEIICAD